jgi:hypothetical protein
MADPVWRAPSSRDTTLATERISTRPDFRRIAEHWEGLGGRGVAGCVKLLAPSEKQSPDNSAGKRRTEDRSETRSAEAPTAKAGQRKRTGQPDRGHRKSDQRSGAADFEGTAEPSEAVAEFLERMEPVDMADGCGPIVGRWLWADGCGPMAAGRWLRGDGCGEMAAGDGCGERRSREGRVVRQSLALRREYQKNLVHRFHAPGNVWWGRLQYGREIASEQ